MVQDYGPVWNLGTNPGEGLAATWAALEACPLNAVLLVRGSSARPEPVEESLRLGGGGLKIHEDVPAGPEQIRCALDVADRHDVQLAIHTDGLNEAGSVEDTLAAFGGRTVHAFHVEGCGGGHAPDLLELRPRARPHLLDDPHGALRRRGRGRAHGDGARGARARPHGRPGDARALRLRVRPGTMAAEGVLHDLGVISMLSSDSQGMGRIGEVVRRAFQNADAMRRLRGPEGGPGDNERLLRHLAKVTINPAVAHGLAGHVGSLEPGKLADAVLWRPELFAVRPELVVKAGIAAWGAAGDGNASTMLCEPVRVGRQLGGLGAAAARLSLAFLARCAMDADLPTTRPRATVENCRDLRAADMVRNARTGAVRVHPTSHEVTLDGEPVAARRLRSSPSRGASCWGEAGGRRPPGRLPDAEDQPDDTSARIRSAAASSPSRTSTRGVSGRPGRTRSS